MQFWPDADCSRHEVGGAARHRRAWSSCCPGDGRSGGEHGNAPRRLHRVQCHGEWRKTIPDASAGDAVRTDSLDQISSRTPSPHRGADILAASCCSQHSFGRWVSPCSPRAAIWPAAALVERPARRAETKVESDHRCQRGDNRQRKTRVGSRRYPTPNLATPQFRSSDRSPS